MWNETGHSLLPEGRHLFVNPVSFSSSLRRSPIRRPKSFGEHSAEAGPFPDETGPSPEPDGREEVAGGSRKTDNRNYLLKAKTVDHGDQGCGVGVGVGVGAGESQ